MPARAGRRARRRRCSRSPAARSIASRATSGGTSRAASFFSISARRLHPHRERAHDEEPRASPSERILDRGAPRVVDLVALGDLELDERLRLDPQPGLAVEPERDRAAARACRRRPRRRRRARSSAAPRPEATASTRLRAAARLLFRRWSSARSSSRSPRCCSPAAAARTTRPRRRPRRRRTTADDRPTTGARPGLEGASTDPAVSKSTSTERRAAHRRPRRVPPGYDRVVFEFRNGVPGYDVRYVQTPVVADGSGEEVAVAGGAVLRDPDGARARRRPDPGVGAADVHRPDRASRPTTAAIVELVRTGGFEAVLTWAAGVDEKRPFRVTRLESPARHRDRRRELE